MGWHVFPTTHRAVDELRPIRVGRGGKNGLARRREAVQNTSSFLKDFAWPVHPEKRPVRLATLATDQGGYFTAKQGKDAGYDYPHLEYHVTARNFERVGHGLYRLLSVPRTEHDELIRFTLWSRSQRGEPQAVVSHESALVLHDLTDLLPDRVHLTVPPKFRKPTPRGCVLHKAVIDRVEVEDRAGFA